MSDRERAVPEFVHKANARRAEAEALQAEAGARKAQAEAGLVELTLDNEERAKQQILASDTYNRVYRFDSSVDSKSVGSAISRLNIWHRLEPGCDITIIFTSPGGEVVAGMAFYDYLIGLRNAGHRLTTVAQGVAASMAGILLQAGEVRVMGRESYLLIHEIQAGVLGSFGEISDRVKWVELVQGRIIEIFASRSKLSKSELKKRWSRTDWWLDSDEALKLGIVDEVR